MKTQDIIEAMANLLSLDKQDLERAFNAFMNDIKAEASC